MKTNPILLCCLLLMGITLSSCFSRLLVKVDIFDREAYLKSDVFQRKKSGFQLALRTEIETLTNSDDSSFAVQLFKQFDSITFIDNEIKADYVAELHTRLKTAKTNHLDNLILIRRYLESNYAELHLLEIQYVNVQTTYNNEIKKIYNWLNIIFKNDPSSSIVLNKSLKISTISLYGGSIQDDEFASFVISSPEKNWKKYKSSILNQEKIKKSHFRKSRSNRTVATTIFGNSDLAVKMEEPGVFIVKGVRLDAEEATRATFKVMNQSIRYMALSYGLPVSPNNGDKQIIIPELEEYKTSKETLSKKDKTSSLHFDILTLKLAEEYLYMKTKGANLEASRLRVRQAFEIFTLMTNS